MSGVRKAVAAAAAALALSLGGCTPMPDAEPPADPSAAESPSATPYPEPEPVKPAIGDLVLSPDGLGPLVIGQAPPVTDPELDIAVFDPDYCADEPLAPDPGMWLANYPFDPEVEHPPFVPIVVDGTLRVIAVFSPEIVTESGVGIGSSREEVLAAFPEGFSSQVEGFASTVYVVNGTTGQLLIEVTSDDAGYWPAGERGIVNILTVMGLDATPVAVSGGDGYFWGVCVGP